MQSRITTQQLLSMLGNKVQHILSSFLCDRNDRYTRSSVVSCITSDIRLIQMMDHRLIYDYKVICDETNNVANSTTLNVDIYIKPYNSLQFFQMEANVGQTLDSMSEQIAELYAQIMKRSGTEL